MKVKMLLLHISTAGAKHAFWQHCSLYLPEKVTWCRKGVLGIQLSSFLCFLWPHIIFASKVCLTFPVVRTVQMVSCFMPACSDNLGRPNKVLPDPGLGGTVYSSHVAGRQVTVSRLLSPSLLWTKAIVWKKAASTSEKVSGSPRKPGFCH